MNFQETDKDIRDKINSLDQKTPAGVQWNPEQSWNKLNQKRGKNHKMAVMFFGASIAASIILLIITGWFIINYKSSKSTKGIQSKNIIQQKIDEPKIAEQKIKKPQIVKEIPTKAYNHEPKRQLQIKTMDTNKNVLFKKPETVKKIVQIRPKEDEIDENILIKSFEENKEMNKQIVKKETKKAINQEVTLTIAPEAQINGRNKKNRSEKTDDDYLTKKGRLKLKIKLSDAEPQLASNKVNISSDNLTGKIRLK